MPAIQKLQNYLDDTVHSKCDYSLYSELKDLVSDCEVQTKEEIDDILNVLLPMALGYAKEHDAGRNQEMVKTIQSKYNLV